MDDLLKRAFDVAVGSVALVLLSPVIALTGALVLLIDGRPVLFHQVRVGRGGALFTMPKYRTMREAFDETGEPLPDDERVTALGRFLRRSRLDDLLGLVPVVAGDMSLVGPRPLPPSVLAGLAGSEERARMRPGLTGLAQVSGNTQLNNQEKIAIDLHYGRTRSFVGDLAIIFRTLATLIVGARRDEALIAEALRLQHMSGPATPVAEGSRP
ncbi:MAG TPA: sugar transferase [Allosphingosinicella sp.]